MAAAGAEAEAGAQIADGAEMTGVEEEATAEAAVVAAGSAGIIRIRERRRRAEISANGSP